MKLASRVLESRTDIVLLSDREGSQSLFEKRSKKRNKRGKKMQKTVEETYCEVNRVNVEGKRKFSV